MEKPILATTIKDVIINGNSWDEAHYEWYDEREKELEEKGLSTEPIDKWRKLLKENPEEEKKTYFRYVNDVMEFLYPTLFQEERTRIARESYFDSVLKFIEKNKDRINEDFLEYLESLKNKYRIAIITTNTWSALEKILKVSNINKDLFDLIEVSKPEEKDDKIIVFDRFIKKHGKPKFYIGSNEKTRSYCNEKKINYILTDFYSNNQFPDSIINLKELKEKIPN